MRFGVSNLNLGLKCVDRVVLKVNCYQLHSFGWLFFSCSEKVRTGGRTETIAGPELSLWGLHKRSISVNNMVAQEPPRLPLMGSYWIKRLKRECGKWTFE